MTINIKSHTKSYLNMKFLILTSLTFSVLFISGCSVGPDYEQPELSVPDVWHQRFADRLIAEGSVDHKWWKGFNDPVLTRLIEKSSIDNLDVKQAVIRIQQARTVVDITSGRYFPEVDAVGAYRRAKISENGLGNAAIGGTPPLTNLNSAGFDSSWEIDVFGKISRSVESASATHQASIENYYDVLVTLYAEIAINYADLRATQKRLVYAKRNIKTQQNTLKLTEGLYDAELVPGLDIEQAKLNLANTEALVPDLLILENNILNRLAVLTGQYPGSLQKDLEVLAEIPGYSNILKAGLPIDLIRQRPDIRRTERQLAAQTAEIGIATVDLYPSFSLSGTFAFESTKSNNLFERPSRAYSFGPSMRWNLFAGNRLRNNIKLQELITDEIYVQYENTVLRAVEEVENAMVEYTQKIKRTDSLEKSVAASEKSTVLVEDLYRNGLTDFQNVLDMQRTLSVQQDNLAQSQGDITKSIVRIYKALGGGWASETEDTPESTEVKPK